MKNVLEWLENSANNFPNKTALICENDSVSYAVLLEKAQRASAAFTEKGERNKPIVVFLDKGIDAVIAMLAVVYSGNCYTIIDTQMPKSRILKIYETLQPLAVITDEEHLPFVKQWCDDAYCIEELKNAEAPKSKLLQIRNRQLDTDPLYILFTSGSTGTPKGVVISHKAVIGFINTFEQTFSFSEEDVFANQAPFDFDVSVKDIYTSLSIGATVAIIPRQMFSNPTLLADYLCEKQTSVMIWAVSALCLLTTFHTLDYKTPETVKKILFSGEVMPVKHLLQWCEKLPECMFVNLYGPTEITCNCTYYIIDNKQIRQPLPIGKPFDDKRVFLLDKNDNEILAANVPGEICVCGASLSSGYYRNEEQTLKSFAQNPLNADYGERMYRTGDLGYYDEDGNLYFSGRKDFQIKHLGHRIELEEIESAIYDVEGIERCCCVFDERKSKLYAFYKGNMEKRELFQTLKEELPLFMIPGALRKRDELPMTKNGKIDRSALKKEVTG